MDAQFVKEFWIVLIFLFGCQLAWFIGMLVIDLDYQRSMNKLYREESESWEK